MNKVNYYEEEDANQVLLSMNLFVRRTTDYMEQGSDVSKATKYDK